MTLEMRIGLRASASLFFYRLPEVSLVLLGMHTPRRTQHSFDLSGETFVVALLLILIFTQVPVLLGKEAVIAWSPSLVFGIHIAMTAANSLLVLSTLSRFVHNWMKMTRLQVPGCGQHAP